MRNKSAFISTLIDMHGYCRPMGSQTETDFIARYIANLPNAECDQSGNWHVTVGDSPILWSCHTDTVHSKEGRQKVRYFKKTGLLALATDSKSSCLGADDTAGVFLCREMILAKVPGHYVFHYGEERGGIGSSELAEKCPEFLKQFQFAIALDRQGHADVITHQGMGRTASDAFAESLCKQLGGFYEPSSHGVYTDTEEYCGIIPECTNVSIGYTRAHSPAESLDTRHVLRLLEKLKTLDASKLVCEREPKRFEYRDYDYPSWYRDTPIRLYDKGVTTEYVWDDREETYVKVEVSPSTSTGGIKQDFQLAEWEARQAALLEEAELMDGREDRLDDYLDPIFAEVQRELKKQFHNRTRH